MNKLYIVLYISFVAVFLSGCVENIKTADSIELPITSINEYPIVYVQHDEGSFWVQYNDNGSIKQAFVRPATSPPRFKVNDEVIISNKSKIIVYYHEGVLLTNGYRNYSLYWAGD